MVGYLIPLRNRLCSNAKTCYKAPFGQIMFRYLTEEQFCHFYCMMYGSSSGDIR
jgi:hypothetical protein